LVQNVHRFPQIEPFLAGLSTQKPDLVMLQEATGKPVEWWQYTVPEYRWMQTGEHLLGSKFPVADVVDHWRTGHVLYRVSVYGETISLFSLHPPSPQFAIKHVLGAASEDEPREWSRMGRLDVLAHDMRRRMGALAAVRDELADADVAIVGGDTNLAQGGWATGEFFSGLTDAFEASGRGFGCTFPAWAPWLRLDRLLVSRSVRVVSLSYTNAVDSDHEGLLVDVEW
jgi:endonuclease/exonuclease/phosphatase family metal-dependent hydrolase